MQCIISVQLSISSLSAEEDSSLLFVQQSVLVDSNEILDDPDLNSSTLQGGSSKPVGTTDGPLSTSKRKSDYATPKQPLSSGENTKPSAAVKPRREVTPVPGRSTARFVDACIIKRLPRPPVQSIIKKLQDRKRNPPSQPCAPLIESNTQSVSSRTTPASDNVKPGVVRKMSSGTGGRRTAISSDRGGDERQNVIQAASFLSGGYCAVSSHMDNVGPLLQNERSSSRQATVNCTQKVSAVQCENKSIGVTRKSTDFESANVHHSEMSRVASSPSHKRPRQNRPVCTVY